QLFNAEDFVAQKNVLGKKITAPVNAYGMPQKPMMKNAAIDNELKSTQTVNELGTSAEAGAQSGSASTGMNSQQFILGAQIDLGASAAVNETVPMKTFN